ncbi:hypothetical protein SAMN04487904_1186 [Actinopolyspora lacussalsi subsp. righensis]|uniref:DUF4412 domain-containing protein n=1 Tax=Actinopolyspora righensis TaxID=995060 RepID=A0A1I7CE15_9ACTN|nr:hypothetical protein [Actinopolyspora righensis]SFT97670.1 hypothetical protein SAMN04487904_1186 [Actinopolyspora righensis]
MRRLAIGLTALALTGVTACGTGQTTQSSGNPSGDASEKTEQSLSPLSNVSALGDAVGDAMQESSTVKMSMRAENFPPEAAKTMNYDCDLELVGQNMHCTGFMDFIMESDTMYMKFPKEMREQRGMTKPWVEMSPEDMGQTSADFSELTKFSDIERMLPEGAEISEKRKTELEGEKAVRYDVAVDMNVMAEKGEEQNRSNAQEMLKGGVEKLHYVYWVDERGLPMRIITKMPPIEGAPEDARMVIDYSDWGKKVDISAPPAEKVNKQFTQGPA